MSPIQCLRFAKGALAGAVMCVAGSCAAEDLATPSPSSATTHCSPRETDYFSCRIAGSQKVVSLCGKPIDEVPPNGDAASLGLEYRFGRISSVELRFPPQEPQPKPDYFFGEHLRPVGEGAVDSLSVTFESKSVTYGVSVREGRDKFAGVWIADGKKYRELSCGTKANADRFFGLVLSLPPMK